VQCDETAVYDNKYETVALVAPRGGPSNPSDTCRSPQIKEGGKCPDGNQSPVRHAREGPGGDKQARKLVSVSDRTSAIVRGLVVILEEHDCRADLVQTICQQIREYLDEASDELVWVKRCKYVLSRPLAQYLRCEQPKVPEKDFQFTGTARRWIKNRLFVFNRKNTHLWYSWFQAKRCSLPCSEMFIQEVYDEHFSSLTRTDPGDEFAIDAAFSNPVYFELLTKIRKKLDKELDKAVCPTVYHASRSACFEVTRTLRGQFHALRRQVMLVDSTALDGSSAQEWLLIPHTSDLNSMWNCARVIGDPYPVVEVRQPSGWEDWRDLALKHQRFDYDSPIRAEIRGIIEPLKVRVISKGEALPYYMHIRLQKALHGIMRKFPCFRLIGKPFCPTHLFDLKKVSQPDWEWFSIDYSAATDGLSWKFSSRIMRFLLDHRSDQEKEAALRVLGPHDLYYPGYNMVSGENESYLRGTQTNGQLMGSILSFPFLCLANLATYLLTMSDIQAGWSLKKRLSGVLVNGDDMIYAAPKEKWERHTKVAGDLGLAMSVGKAYHHPIYANINSTSVLFDLRKEESVPFKIDYLNLGLLFNSETQRKKGQDKKDEEECAPIVGGLNCLLSGCRDEKSKARILVRFLGLHREEIRKETRVYLVYPKREVLYTRNLFIPPDRGGMGVVPPLGWRYRISPFDRVLAKNLVHFGVSHSLGRPPPGFELFEAERSVSCPWSKPLKERDIPSFVIRQWVRTNELRMFSKAPRSLCLSIPLVPYGANPSTFLSAPRCIPKFHRPVTIMEMLDGLDM
jgi:hypothetical protein